jgi:hypothetical protein
MTTGTRNTVLGPTAAQGMRWRSVTMNRPGFYGTPSFWEGRLACLGSTVRIPGSKVVRLVVSMPELRDRVRGDQHGGRRLRVAAETLRQWIRQAESWTLTRAPGICCSARHDAEGKGLRAAFPAPEDTPERHPSEIGLIMRAAFVLTLFEYKRLTWKLLRKPHLIT